MTSEQEKLYLKRIDELLSERDLAKRELAKLRERTADAEGWKQKADALEIALKARGRMEDVMIEALEPFASRARGSNYVPDDGTVTVFMKDCRLALDAVNPVTAAARAQSSYEVGVGAVDKIKDALDGIRARGLNLKAYATGWERHHWKASLWVDDVDGETVCYGPSAWEALEAAGAAAHIRLQESKQERSYGAC
ncbi:hypothetical protein ADL19_14705 [Streptomyces purpurogeneiscleroticus]|nr:hypothetical protein ADL19_14705 [Streptomyces purpurogeneiscleroticus]